MDGVLSDTYAQYMKYEFEDLQITQKLTDLIGIPEDEAFVNQRTYINSVDFFLTAKPIDGSIDILKRLHSMYQVYIVSAATQFPLSLGEKMKWLAQYFPFIHWKQVVLCGSKEVVKGDIMIDDHFVNLDGFEGKTILFSQPHNMSEHNHRHTRVRNWKEIETMLAK